MPVEIQKKYSDVPWAKMKGLRNILAHDYDQIALPIVWKTVTEDLPRLAHKLEKIRANESAQ